MRVLLVGGGTGGHITPLLAVARELKNLRTDIIIEAVTDRRAKFAFLLDDNTDIHTVHRISAGKYRRYPNENFIKKITDTHTVALNVRDVFSTLAGFGQALSILRKNKPDIIFIKGGFVGVPIGVAAYILGIPFITHDSDTVPGLANRLIGRWARIHAVGMPGHFYNYPAKKTKYVGIPVSDNYHNISEKERRAYKQEFGWPAKTKVVLVIGGSQGAAQLNRIVSLSKKQFVANHNLAILHQTGTTKHRHIGSAQYKPFSFSTELFKYSAAADVVITRAGASTIAELAVQGRAVILVPSPHLSGGHQIKNAEHMTKQGAALHLQEKQILQHPELLINSVETILANPIIQTQYERNIRKLAKPDAALSIAKLIITCA